MREADKRKARLVLCTIINSHTDSSDSCFYKTWDRWYIKQHSRVRLGNARCFTDVTDVHTTKCWGLPHSSVKSKKPNFASELRKQLKVGDNWGWWRIHSSLSDAGLSPSRGWRKAHMCVKVSANLWLYIKLARVWYIITSVYPHN